MSIPSNIAEGDDSGTNKQAVRYFNVARGSAAELYTQLIIAHEIGYISNETSHQLKEECHGISGMLMKLIKARR